VQRALDESCGCACIRPTQAVRWTLLKLACVTLGLGGAAAIALWPKWVRLTAPVSTVAWATGVGLVLSQTLIG
jgi:hypothetical protein